MKKVINNKNGFSLLELLVSISIFFLLLVMVAPSYTAWLASLRVKNVAEGINLGLLQARSEAIRRNEFVYFSLNEDTSWSIVIAETGNIINQKAPNEGNDTTQIVYYPENSNTVTFDGLGYLVSNVDGSPLMENIDIASTLDIEAIKSFRVRIDGGTNFICDPTIIDDEHFSYCKEY